MYYVIRYYRSGMHNIGPELHSLDTAARSARNFTQSRNRIRADVRSAQDHHIISAYFYREV